MKSSAVIVIVIAGLVIAGVLLWYRTKPGKVKPPIDKSLNGTFEILP